MTDKIDSEIDPGAGGNGSQQANQAGPEPAGERKSDGRFKKGQSGNRKGRPKRKTIRDLSAVVAEVMAEPVTISINGRKRTMNALEALTETIRIAALKGNKKAMRRYFRLAARTGLLPKDDNSPGVQIGEPPTDARTAKMLRGMKAVHPEGLPWAIQPNPPTA